MGLDHPIHRPSRLLKHAPNVMGMATVGWNHPACEVQVRCPSLAIAVGFPKLASPLVAVAIACTRVLDALNVQNQLAEVADTGGLLQVILYLSGLSGGSQFLLNVTIFTIMHEFMFN